MRLDGYIRVSDVRGRGGESFISPKVQREQVEQWAGLRGVEIAGWQTDLDQTGGKLDRPGLDRIMDRIKDGQTDGIAVARLDRLSRAGVADALRLIEDINQHGGELAAVDLGIDPTTPFGEFALVVMLGLARMQRRNIADSWRESRRQAVERGVHVSSRPPTGYERGEGGRLVPSEAADAIRKVFAARAEGASSWGDLSAILEDAGVRTSYGAANWTDRSISHLIENRAYLGEGRSGEFVNTSAHEPIVDESVWAAAQRAPGKQSPRGTSLLGGILRCAGCRYTLKTDKMTDRKGERIRIYRCRGKRAAGKCPAPATVLGSVAEPWVERQFFEHFGDLRVKGVAASVEVDAAEADMRARAAELDAYLEATSAFADREAFQAGAQKREAALADAEGAWIKAREVAGVEEIPDVADLRETWPDLSVGERRQVLSGAIHSAFLRRVGQVNVPIEERAIIFWRGDGPDDLPGPGRRGGKIVSLDW